MKGIGITPRGCGTIQTEVRRQQNEDELVRVREHARHLEDEVAMRRTLDAFNERKLYELLLQLDQLERVNREQQDEMDRLRSTTSPPAEVAFRNFH